MKRKIITGEKKTSNVLTVKKPFQNRLHYHVQVNHPDEVRKEQAPAFVSLCQTAILYFGALNRVAEVVRRHEGPSPKSLDLDENFKPKHMQY